MFHLVSNSIAGTNLKRLGVAPWLSSFLVSFRFATQRVCVRALLTRATRGKANKHCGNKTKRASQRAPTSLGAVGAIASHRIKMLSVPSLRVVYFRCFWCHVARCCVAFCCRSLSRYPCPLSAPGFGCDQTSPSRFSDTSPEPSVSPPIVPFLPLSFGLFSFCLGSAVGPAEHMAGLADVPGDRILVELAPLGGLHGRNPGTGSVCLG
mmetsp:Transcript_3381/g.7426  ORF Transcript_3381/g.7426 Transcript_3381/m.7426 type:complete len:208 (-) Transcript_3381:701-1324(-)